MSSKQYQLFDLFEPIVKYIPYYIMECISAWFQNKPMITDKKSGY